MTKENGEGGGHDDRLEKAVQDLEKAQEHRAEARAEELKADHEMEDALKEIQEAEHDRVEVHVTHVNEVEHASFKERRSATLGKVWDRSYGELKIARKPKDIFQTGGDAPKSLMTHLNLTLEQAHEKKVIVDYCFGIVSETGGA